jgi:hypothetical protein
MDRGNNKFPPTVAVKPGGGDETLEKAPTAPIKHICSRCNGEYATKAILIVHYRTLHLETKIFVYKVHIQFIAPAGRLAPASEVAGRHTIPF